MYFSAFPYCTNKIIKQNKSKREDVNVKMIYNLYDF